MTKLKLLQRKPITLLKPIENVQIDYFFKNKMNCLIFIFNKAKKKFFLDQSIVSFYLKILICRNL